MAADNPKPNPPADLNVYADYGDAVNWYAGGDPSLTPVVGIVIAKSPGFAPGTSNLTLATLTGTGIGYRDGVLHMSNDRCRRQGNNGGGWAHRPLDLAFKQFMLAVGALKWDGKEDYVSNPDFNPGLLGRMLAELAIMPAVNTDPGRPGRHPGGGKTDSASGSVPPVPPVPPPPPA